MNASKVQQRHGLLFTAICAGMLVCVMLFMLLGLLPQQAQAATIREKEPNNTSARATALPFRAYCHGVIQDGTDCDYFKVTLPSDGKLALGFRHEDAQSTENCWSLTLLDSQKNAISMEYFEGTASPTDTVSTGLSAGDYYVLVEKCSSSAVGVEYILAANHEPSTTWERELNNNVAMASPVVTKTRYYGVNHDAADPDYFKLTVSERGYYSVNFQHEQIAVADCWRVKLYDAQERLLNTDNFKGVYKSDDGKELKLSPGTYYLCVESSEPSSVGVEYGLAVKKSAQAISKAKTAKSFKVSTIAKKSGSFKIAAKARGGAKLTYKVSKRIKTGKITAAKVKKYVSVSPSGKVTVKKGAPKGTYKLKVKISAPATSYFGAKSITKTIKVSLK